MDRHKFRVWDNDNERYLQHGTFALINGTIAVWDFFKSKPGHSFFDQEHNRNLTVEQCTGLKDKNGKLIFEGDIANLYIKGEWCGVCRFFWDEEEPGFYHTWQEVFDGELADSHRPSKRLWLNPDCEFEIIGNIHEVQDGR